MGDSGVPVILKKNRFLPMPENAERESYFANGQRWFWGVILFGGLGRLFLYWWFGAPFERAIAAAPGHAPDYRTALTDHFWAFLLYNHTVPPLNIVRDGLCELLFGPDGVGRAKLLLSAGLDCFAGGFTVLIARRLRVGAALSVLAGVLGTSRLMLWEARGLGDGWDTLDPFFVALFALVLLRAMANPTPGRCLSVAGIGSLTILAFNFGAPMVVPGIAVAGYVIGMRMRRPLRFAAVAAILLSLPLATVAAIVAKNGLQHDLWSLSSGAGQNIMQAYNSGLPDPSNRERGAYRLAERNGYPAWWLWCYDEAERRKLHSLRNWAGWYGTCMFRVDNNLFVPDYAALHEYFTLHPDPYMRALVEKDMKIARERPWLWSGPVTVRATGVSVAYGKISARIMGDTLLAKPDYFLRRAYRTFLEHWLTNGGYSYVLRNRAAYNEPSVLWLLNLAGVGLFFLGTGLALYRFWRCAWRFCRRLGTGTLDAVMGGAAAETVVLSACIVPPMFASILLACCENYRHALMLLPLLLALAIEASGRRSFWTAWGPFGRRLAARLRLYRPAGEAR